MEAGGTGGGKTGGGRVWAGSVAASLATVLAAAGLIAFAHLGAFDDGNDPFPHSVVAIRS
jgi:hypothetical protein